MEDRLNELFADWHRIGGCVLLRLPPEPRPMPDIERLSAESTVHCRESSRLMWVVLHWLVHHADSIDGRRLLEFTRSMGSLPVLGLLCDMALERIQSDTLEDLRDACNANADREIFFHRVARSPLAARLAAEESLEIYQRWNFWGRELEYLS